MSPDNESGNDDLPDELRKLSEKLSHTHEITARRRKAQSRAESLSRGYLYALYGAVVVTILIESIIGQYFAQVSDSGGNHLWIPGPSAFVNILAVVGLVFLVGLLVTAPEWIAMYARGRPLKNSVRGVVLGTDTVTVTLPSRKEGYLAETAYVYEISDVRYKGAYQPRAIASRKLRALDRTKVRFPPGKVVEVYYDPDNPGTSSLSRGPSTIMAIGQALALFFATWLVSAGLSSGSHEFLLIVVLVLGVAIVSGVKKEGRQFQNGP